MKKRFLLLMLIMCLFGGINLKTLNAQNVVTIGDGQKDSQYVPFNANADGSISQTYYLKSEIGEANKGKTITAISYKQKSGKSPFSHEIEIYMVNTESTNAGGVTMAKLNSSDLVYSGEVEFRIDEWVSITLDTPFSYTGDNILVCINDKYIESFASPAPKFYCYSTDAYKTLYKSNTSKETYDPTTSAIRASNSVYTPCVQFTFSGTSTPPTAPTLNSPEDKTTGVINPTLQFTLSNNTTQYQILLDKNEDPITAVNNWTDGNGDVSYQTSDLDADATYYWKVIAKNDAGEAESEVYSFTTLAPPTAPTLVSPTNEATGVVNPTLQFTLSNNTTQYQILLDKNEDPAAVVKDWTDGNGDVSYQTSNLEAGATYYWKVIAKNGAGEAESNIYQFTTSNIFPVTEYEIKLNGNNITLEWQYADQKANEYQVCFGNSEVDMEPWHQPEWMSRDVVEGTTLVEDGSFTFVDGILDKGAYFRVNVRKDGGESVEGATAFFVVLDEEQEWADSYNNANDVFVRANVSVATNITAKNITIENGGILKIITNVVLSANTLVVNEGGQFFAANTATYFPINTVKFNKNIANPDEWEANNKTGWQFISSPFKDASISSFIPGQEEGDYDLYRYDGSAE